MIVWPSLEVASRQHTVVIGWATSLEVGRSVGDRPKPIGGMIGAAVVMKMSGENGGAIEGNWVRLGFWW